MHEILLGEFTGERGASLEALERRGAGEYQAWINRR